MLYAVVLAAMGWAGGMAHAKLPPPTPEELAQKRATTDKKARDESAAKAALARAQDRVVQRYLARYPHASAKKSAKHGAVPLESHADIEE
jgi:hypothetical protein